MSLRILRHSAFCIFLIFSIGGLSAQPSNNQKVDSIGSIASLAAAYKAAPGTATIYADYLDALLLAKEYRDAENLITTQQRYSSTPLLLVDLGRVFAGAGKEKKAIDQYEKALTAINGDDLLTDRLARAFTQIDRDDYAIKAYERHRSLLQNNFLYSGPLARLYAKAGATDKATDALLDGAPYQQGGVEEVKSTLLELLGNDPKKLQGAQKALIKRINLQPDNLFYTELLTWLYTQKGDWEGALLQMQAIDARNRESGNRLLVFAQTALKASQYEVALKSIASVAEKGKESPLYPVALAAQLYVKQQQLEETPAYTAASVADLSRDYDSFFSAYPQYNTGSVLNDYARLEARYNNNPRKAINLLKKAIAMPGISREAAGRSKLDLGDYQILDGQVWEASLTYSQVDKAFREDMLGEEARFRNGKLAYYRGDFAWAQGQLSVLKASTSELIANDALALSVLITENTPDSNNAPLLAYARADLLLFQNKTAEATQLLDSIVAAYPKHPLNDDILMERAAIAMTRHDFIAATTYYAQVIEKYGKDVLADDALFKMADVYDRYLKKPVEAQKYYEQLIIDYPGSTYVQSARTKLAQLSAGILGT